MGERPLEAFNSRGLKEVFEPKRNEITKEWLELLNYLYFSPFIIWVIKQRRMFGRGILHLWGEETGAYRIVVRKAEGDHLEKPRHRWESNTKGIK
jgi:hypothetical protein